MDFNFSEEQAALGELAREILSKELSQARLKELEAEGEFFDRVTWSKLANAQLLGLAIPEAFGGMGMGFVELCVLLREAGRAVLPAPLLPALVLAGLPIARFGSELQRKQWLTPLANGELVLTGAFEPGVAVAARRDGDEWVLDGVCPNVPAMDLAERVLVPAKSTASDSIFLVAPESDGVTLLRQENSRHEPLFQVTLGGVRVPADAVLEGDESTEWVREHALVALAATQLGVSERALEITTDYLKEREQFGAPLGSLPAVQHRCADCYIALDALRWVTWQAAWRLAAGEPAARDARVAKFWAADAGSKIGTATQHLHGGMGVDLDYPIHRFFLWSKSLELALGGATPQLLEIGRDMARTGPQELA